jgi:PAS domain S-box-containing protein
MDCGQIKQSQNRRSSIIYLNNNGFKGSAFSEPSVKSSSLGEICRSIIEPFPDPVILIDAETGEFVSFNESAHKSLGYTREEFQNLKVPDLEAIESAEQVTKHIEKVVLQGSDFFETKHRTKDGQILNVQVSVKAIRIGEKNFIQAIFRDVTERKKAEQQILVANERLQYLLSSTSAVIYTSKTYGDYGATFISDNVREMTGYEPQKFIEEPSLWLDHIHPEDVERVLKEVQNIFKKDRYAYEYRFQHKDGRYIWMRDEMKLVRDNNGNPLEIIGYWIDITDRKRAEEVLLESEKLAAKGRLAAQIAHEINNPLAGIKNSLLLVEGAVNKDSPYSRYLGLVKKEINRLAHIVQQIFELYQPTETEVTEFAVDDTISEVATLLESICRQYNVLVSVKKSGCIARLPEALLRQVLYNIIKNAIEASSAGGLVEITPKITDNTLVITVRDRGVGIAENIKPHIFEPAFTTKKGLKTGGIGLGLSVSKSIIEEMSGRIEFESKEGRGATFRIIVPFDKSLEDAKDD